MKYFKYATLEFKKKTFVPIGVANYPIVLRMLSKSLYHYAVLAALDCDEQLKKNTLKKK